MVKSCSLQPILSEMELLSEIRSRRSRSWFRAGKDFSFDQDPASGPFALGRLGVRSWPWPALIPQASLLQGTAARAACMSQDRYPCRSAVFFLRLRTECAQKGQGSPNERLGLIRWDGEFLSFIRGDWRSVSGFNNVAHLVRNFAALWAAPGHGSSRLTPLPPTHVCLSLMSATRRNICRTAGPASMSGSTPCVKSVVWSAPTAISLHATLQVHVDPPCLSIRWAQRAVDPSGRKEPSI